MPDLTSPSLDPVCVIKAVNGKELRKYLTLLLSEHLEPMAAKAMSPSVSLRYQNFTFQTPAAKDGFCKITPEMCSEAVDSLCRKVKLNGEVLAPLSTGAVFALNVNGSAGSGKEVSFTLNVAYASPERHSGQTEAVGGEDKVAVTKQMLETAILELTGNADPRDVQDIWKSWGGSQR